MSNYQSKLHKTTQSTTKTSQSIKTSQSGVQAIISRVGDGQHSYEDVMQLQRVIGNAATAALLGQSLQREDDELPEPAEGTTRSDPSDKKYKDFDGKQYRVSGKEPNRKIQEVKRLDTVDGEVYYVALGEVVGFSDKKPVVDYYDEPIDLGDWYPSVTHVNGMNVKPQSGIRDALSLQASINEELENAGDDIALGQDAVDVLYTYSTTLDFVPDVWDCLKGKLGYTDQVIGIQKQTMLDAVHGKYRVHISAHSRGTIKTDNAVREAYAALIEEIVPQIWQEVGGSIDLTEKNKKKVSSAIRDIAKVRAGELMDEYIHLVYAGNAVEFPSSVLPVDFVVGSYDAISLLVGTYTEWGTQESIFGYGHDESTMTGTSGGHGYQGYAPTVGELIGKDIIREK